MRQAGKIGNSLQAKVKIRAGTDAAAHLRRHAADLRYIFIVSQVEVDSEPDGEAETLKVEVAQADGAKCERCWNYSTEVGKYADWPTLCERCAPVVRDLRGKDLARS